MRPVPVREGQHGREQAGIPVPESGTGLPEGQPALWAWQASTITFGPIQFLGRECDADVGRPLHVAAREQHQPLRVLRRGRTQTKSEPAGLCGADVRLPLDRGQVATQLEHPRRRVGKEPFHQTLIATLDAGSIENRPGQGEVGQGVCASNHVVTLRPWAGHAPRPLAQASNDQTRAHLTVGR